MSCCYSSYFAGVFVLQPLGIGLKVLKTSVQPQLGRIVGCSVRTNQPESERILKTEKNGRLYTMT
jgi:hypothetical protein